MKPLVQKKVDVLSKQGMKLKWRQFVLPYMINVLVSFLGLHLQYVVNDFFYWDSAALGPSVGFSHSHMQMLACW